MVSGRATASLLPITVPALPFSIYMPRGTDKAPVTCDIDIASASARCSSEGAAALTLKSAVMLKSAFFIMPTVLLAQAASAANISGPGALALAGVVASHETGLSAAKRLVISKLFAGHHPSYPAGQKIIIKAN